MDEQTNRHWVDLFWEHRFGNRAWKKKDREFRDYALTHQDDLRGETAWVKVYHGPEKVDLRALIDHFGHEAIAPFLKRPLRVQPFPISKDEKVGKPRRPKKRT